MAREVSSLADLDEAIRLVGQHPAPVLDIQRVGALYRELDAVHRVAIPRLLADPANSVHTANIRRSADAIEGFALKAGGSIQEPAIAFANHLHLVAHHAYSGDPDAAWLTTELNQLQDEFHVLAATDVDFTVGPPGI